MDAGFFVLFRRSIMQHVFSPLVAMYQTQLEVSKRCADAVFSGTEKLDRAVIEATHRAFNEQLNFAQAITAVRDPQSAGNTMRSRFLSRTPDDALSYQTEIMRIVTEMQTDIGKSLQAYVDQLGVSATSGVSAVRESSPLQLQSTDAAFNPMTSMFSVWESAFKEVASMAKKNMMAARSTMEDAASTAIQRASNGVSAAARTSAIVGEETSDDEGRGSPSASGSKKK